MSNTETTAAPKKDVAKILAWLIAIIGVIMVIIGIVAYGGISAQLKAQGITVEEVTKQDPGPLAGKDVAGPFTALAQVNGIQQHTIGTTSACTYSDGTTVFPGGATFGQIPRVASNDGLTYSSAVTVSDGTSTDKADHAKGDALSKTDTCIYNARNTAEQSGFLQASLMLPVLAFAVAVFIIGVGLTVLVIGLALLANGRKKAVAKAETDVEAVEEAVKESKK
ncbi:MAG: hypothetical protein FWD80_05930 [Propionibacteriaceae bacterium]|nr:hypothetical protein [Propionibacteriaceae bacterium]